MILFWKLLPVLAGLGCIAAAFLPEQKQHITDPIYTDGIIIGKNVQKVWRNRSETEAMAPVCRFMTENGEMTASDRQFVPDWQYHYQNGEQVRICYSRQHPEQFRICRGNIWRKSVLLTLGITTLLAYGILLLQYH